MKKMKLYGLAGVAALAAVGGTFAYYSASQTFNNPFDTTNYSTSSVEKFNPSGDNEEWKPGSTVDKVVYATNTGDGDVWVRVKFDEKWMKQDTDHTLLTFGNAAAKENYKDGYQFGSIDGLVVFGVGGETGSITAKDSKKHQGIGDGYEKDGNVSQDSGSVVVKNLAADWNTNWAFNPKDGYFYYRSALTTTAKDTKPLLESVTLCADTDMGHFDEPVYYIAVDKGADKPAFDESGWKQLSDEAKKADYKGWTYGVPEKGDDKLKEKDVYTYKGNILDEDLPGYANADYQLDITVDFIQTTKDGEVIDGSTWDKDFLTSLGLLPAAATQG